MRVLVTGGAGYIGSHVVRALISAGHQPVALDSLATGKREWLPDGVPFIHADLAAIPRPILDSASFDAVVHLAAYADLRSNWKDHGERARLLGSNAVHRRRDGGACHGQNKWAPI